MAAVKDAAMPLPKRELHSAQRDPDRFSHGKAHVAT
jgi:hypothetical protein